MYGPRQTIPGLQGEGREEAKEDRLSILDSMGYAPGSKHDEAQIRPCEASEGSGRLAVKQAIGRVSSPLFNPGLWPLKQEISLA